jgi:hypothetical protein
MEWNYFSPMLQEVRIYKEGIRNEKFTDFLVLALHVYLLEDWELRGWRRNGWEVRWREREMKG